MTTPIYDFINAYRSSATARLHMPGHKGRGGLGCEAMDITEISGADSLYDAEGIIGESEKNATALFGSARTVYSTEGSTQCVKAMLFLASLWARQERGTAQNARPLFWAGRNAHKAFIYAIAALDGRVEWLYPAEDAGLCACEITAETLEQRLLACGELPAAVYVTSPDYLGNRLDIASLAAVCHRHGTRLLVDNAHGAYLHFLPEPCHPMDLGADFCCDSAHKTLVVLTGGAYLHAGKTVPERVLAQMKQAMAMFGSTSPSYLTLASIDLCNARLAGDYPRELAATVIELETLRAQLRTQGWRVPETDPLRITVAAPDGLSGENLAQRLRSNGGECEYADKDFLVLMLTPDNEEKDYQLIADALGTNTRPYGARELLRLTPAESACSIRTAVFSVQERTPVSEAVGRICASPTVACPPAIPVAVSGEKIGEAQLRLMLAYGITQVNVVCELNGEAADGR